MTDFNDDHDPEVLADLADLSRKALREDAPEPGLAERRRIREAARTAGERADDREADLMAARDGYNPGW